MNKSRKTSNLYNIVTYDDSGNVVLPASLTLGSSPASNDNSSKVATTSWIASYISSLSLATSSSVTTAISNLVAAAPTTLDTLNELATALGNDPNFATTVSASIGTKVPQARTITINGTAYDLSADRSWTIAAGVTSFNTRTGAITLTSGDVTGALGYTPYNSTNPNGYISSYTETDTLATVTARGASTTAGITVNGRMTAAGGGTYAVTGSSTQRYIIQALNTSNSVNSSYGWWWFHNANGDMGFHADAVGDILTLTRAGGASVNGNTILTAGNYTSYTYSTTDADSRFLRGTTNPGSVNNFTISIGNNGSYSYVQSHSGQALYLNPVGNSIVLNSTTSINGTLAVSSNTSWFSSTAAISLENQSTFARFAFYGLDFWDWDHGRQMLLNNNYVYVDNYLQAGNSLRAPIFYDSNDTAYYLDANDYSRLNKLVLNQSRVNSSRYPIGHYTPGETVFEIDPTWSNDQLQAYFNSGSVAWTNDSGAPGGYAIRIDGSVNVGGAYSSGFPYIPVDQDDIFYMECWIKSVSGTITHYMGSIDYDSGFSSLGGNPGSFGYWTMSNTSTSTSWQKVAGYITGFGGSTGQFVNGTKYWTPQALFNYGQVSGSSCVISGWKVIRVGHAGNRTFRNNITVSGQINLGTTTTRLIADVATGYLKLYGSASNYLGIGPYNNNGWLYFENIGNSNGVYFNSPGRYAFDSVDVTPYNDAENSLGNGSYRWAQVYTSGWLRQYGAQGMYNQDYGTHFYSSGSASWNVTGSGGNVELVFRSNHQSTVRGYVYADTSNQIGFLHSGGGWSLRTTSDKNAFIHGQTLTINADNAGWSSIYMNDGDEGQREIHCNSNRIGFLNQSSSWGSWCDDSGNWLTGAGMYATIFYDYDNGGYYLDPNSTSNLLHIQMPHRGNGTPNILVNNGGSENWGAIHIEGGSGNLRIGKSDAGRSWSGRVSLAMHVGASESFRVHSDGWDSLFEVWGSSGYARLKGSLEVGSDVYLGVRGTWLSSWLNQNLKTGDNVTFNEVTAGYHRSYYLTGRYDVSVDHTYGIYFSSYVDYSYAIFRESGSWVHPYPDLRIAFHTGIKIGAYYGYNGTRFYNNSDMATITASVNDGDNNFRGYYDIIAYASDKRLKHNVKPIENAISKVMSLTGMTYEWNSIASKHGWQPSKEREAGVFAQDVQAVLPEAVRPAPFDHAHDENGNSYSKSGENFLTVKYEKIVPLLIEGIKEQQAQIEAQGAQITELMEIIKTLKGL